MNDFDAIDRYLEGLPGGPADPELDAVEEDVEDEGPVCLSCGGLGLLLEAGGRCVGCIVAEATKEGP